MAFAQRRTRSIAIPIISGGGGGGGGGGIIAIRRLVLVLTLCRVRVIRIGRRSRTT